ncbi:hypothetical protein [Luteimonas terrae]|uniref:Uncharacterized protein n=1 Tax=Luteimonas terrae TaxID=1530191 RepID=A0ABU1XV72_9GAMM|nr:hypothetical protein [Luteimonas terrae]MDR7192638.1 hypothetical protein [Luteimonas terrae]
MNTPSGPSQGSWFSRLDGSLKVFLAIAAFIGMAYGGFKWQDAQRENVKEAEQARDAAIIASDQLREDNEQLRARLQTESQGMQCLNVLPDWQKELAVCRESLGKWQANGGIFQRINALQQSSGQLKRESDSLLRSGFTGIAKDQLNDGEQSALEELKRRDGNIQQQILDLQHRLHCEC